MKKIAVVCLAAVMIMGSVVSGWPQCPEDPYDAGICDTLYLERYPQDETLFVPGPFLVRFPIYVTHDVPNPSTDSICGFVLPFCYDDEGAGGYCSLSGYWNNTELYPSASIDRSIFRHLPDNATRLIENRMMLMSEAMMGWEWDFTILDLDGTSHFWFTTVPTGNADRKWEEGSRVLLATMTFKVSEECRNLIIDTCFWPPASRLVFSDCQAETYVPRHSLPVSSWVGIPGGWVDCPPADVRYANGAYQSTGLFTAGCEPCGHVASVQVASPLPPGVSDVAIVYTTPPGSQYADGHVTYTVTDHCQSGGWLDLLVFNNVVNGPVGECWFNIILSNTAPRVKPDTVRALADYGFTFRVYGDDPDCDSVTAIEFEGMWYQSDSLQPPANNPSCEDGYPAVFTWFPTQADTGVWLCSFSATDACGAAGNSRTTILVGPVFCGDNTLDEAINVADVIYLLNYLYAGGPAPDPICKADANCDGVANVGDAILLLNYLFRLGTAPCFGCCPE
jgi:hypothetical protein